jgi:hypothetical protein
MKLLDRLLVHAQKALQRGDVKTYEIIMAEHKRIYNAEEDRKIWGEKMQKGKVTEQQNSKTE